MSRRALVASVAAAAVLAAGVVGGVVLRPWSDRSPAPVAAASAVDRRSSEAAPAEGAATDPSNTKQVTGAVSSSGAAGAGAPEPGASGSGAAPASTEGFRTGELALAVSVSPACAAAGDRITAVITAPPGAHVSLVVSYADGRNYGEMYAGPVAPDGSLSYPWVVPATAKAGEGRVLVAGHDPSADRSGTNGSAFTVTKGKKQC